MTRMFFILSGAVLVLAACAPTPAPTETMTVTPAATLTASATPTPPPTPTETPEPGLSKDLITQAEEFFGGSFGIDKDGNLVASDGTKVEGIKIVAGENGGWAWVKAGETPEQDVTGTPEELAKTKYIVDGHETGDWDGPGWRLEKDGTLVATKTFTLTTGETWTMPAFDDIESSIAYVSAHARWESDNRDNAVDVLHVGPEAGRFSPKARALPGFVKGRFGGTTYPFDLNSSTYFALMIYDTDDGNSFVRYMDNDNNIRLVYVDVRWQDFAMWMGLAPPPGGF